MNSPLSLFRFEIGSALGLNVAPGLPAAGGAFSTASCFCDRFAIA
jgi:hypothetical protein